MVRVKTIKAIKPKKITLAKPKAITMSVKTRIPGYGRKK